MRNTSKLRNALVLTALTGGLLTATTAPAYAYAYAYWYHYYAGAYSTAAECEEARLAFIERMNEGGHLFIARPCAYQENNPDTGSGSAGWYYRWGVPAS